MLLDSKSHSDLGCHKDSADFVSAFEFGVWMLVAIDKQEFLLLHLCDVNVSDLFAAVFLDKNVSFRHLLELIRLEWKLLDVLLESLTGLGINQL